MVLREVFPETASAPRVFPWNPCQREMTLYFDRLPLYTKNCRAIFSAFSIASDPPEHSMTLLYPCGARLKSFSAKSMEARFRKCCGGT